MSKILLKSVQKKTILIIAVLFFVATDVWAQCGQPEFCNSNAGLYSNNNPDEIEYDNMGSAFHSSFIREPGSIWKVWGECMNADGVSNALAPTDFNAANYPGLTGTLYKMAIGSRMTNQVQLVVLTSTGLFVLGTENVVIDAAITNSAAFQKITIAGKTDGLPLNVSPENVKMLFATTGALVLTTCDQSVYVLSKDFANLRGNGGTGNALEWSRVMQDAQTPLANVIVARATVDVAFALKADGTIWTWGDQCLLGDGTVASNRVYATQMVLPQEIPGVKMIQMTTHYETNCSYFLLGTDQKVYGLGNNGYGELGDQTENEALDWVNAKNPDGTVISDAAWISANEHDYISPGIAVIKDGGLLYTAGSNSSFMIGRNANENTNFLDLPNGVATTDVITHAEVGGHSTALIKQGSSRYGYVGHRVHGSMGDGTPLISIQESFDFITPPIIVVCGMLCPEPTLDYINPVCSGYQAVFTISGTAEDVVTYKINEGQEQTVVLNALGWATVTVQNVRSVQRLTLTHILGSNGSCSTSLAITATVNPEELYCEIQKGISPNGDWYNDFFDLRFLQVSQLRIFNRYGIKVYSKDDYQTEWHGQTDSGAELPDGVYYYAIDLNGETSKTGWIYLNR